MTYSIELIGAVGGKEGYKAQDILDILGEGPENLKHGEEFTGRPGTCLYLNDTSVLKVRNEIRLDPRSAVRWAKLALEKEQSYGVYHPGKTWFVATLIGHESEPPLIGNICPRLTPLHVYLGNEAAEKTTAETRLRYLCDLFDEYYRVAIECNRRLDEGLSNFGVDGEGHLYYLDDDTYNWDRFVSCAHMLGVFMRSLNWLRGEYAARLGAHLHERIMHYFKEYHYVSVLAEQLYHVFMPNEAQREAMENLVNALKHRGGQKKAVASAPDFESERYLAVLADIHANLPALEATLSYLTLRNIKNGIVLGDVVGYGPHPTECIKRLQESGFVVLKGNHDHGLATGQFQKGFSSTASWVLDWSSQRISAEDKEWLSELLPVLRTEKWLALHGSPMDPTFFNAYVYDMTYEQNLNFMDEKDIRLCFHGHTHLPGLYARKGRLDDNYTGEETASLNGFSRILVCPGSVGQPRNHRAGAQFAIYDKEEDKVHFHSVPYDMNSVMQHMEDEGFPRALVSILRNTR